jgi:hypothetical protein
MGIQHLLTTYYLSWTSHTGFLPPREAHLCTHMDGLGLYILSNVLNWLRVRNIGEQQISAAGILTICTRVPRPSAASDLMVGALSDYDAIKDGDWAHRTLGIDLRGSLLELCPARCVSSHSLHSGPQ